jgi:hypothetical protein
MELRNNRIAIYESDTVQNHDPIDEFDLCPENGEVTVHSSVTPTELPNTASSDLPYILRLEFVPDTTCWPGRYGIKRASFYFFNGGNILISGSEKGCKPTFILIQTDSYFVEYSHASTIHFD